MRFNRVVMFLCLAMGCVFVLHTLEDATGTSMQLGGFIPEVVNLTVAQSWNIISSEETEQGTTIVATTTFTLQSNTRDRSILVRLDEELPEGVIVSMQMHPFISISSGEVLLSMVEQELARTQVGTEVGNIEMKVKLPTNIIYGTFPITVSFITRR